MLVRFINTVQRKGVAASSVQQCLDGRLASGSWTVHHQQLRDASAVARSLPSPKIQFSIPLNSLDTRPDCYRVYKEWCDEVEDDLRTVCTRCVSLNMEGCIHI